MERTNLRPARPALGATNTRPTFNLFRRKQEADLLCAVPQDCPVPRFLDASTWAFVGTVREPTTVLSNFNRRAAEASVRFNGFYLFEADLIEPTWITVPSQSRQQDEGVRTWPWMPDAATSSSAPGQGCEELETRAL